MYESPWDSVRLSARQQWTHASCKLKPKLPHMCSALSSNAQPKQACFLRHRERPQVLFWARLTLLWILFHHALNRGSRLTGQTWVVYVLPQRQAANTLHVALIRMRRMLADEYQLLAAFNASANVPPINLASTRRGRPRSRAETPIWEGIITPRAVAGSSSLLLTALLNRFIIPFGLGGRYGWEANGCLAAVRGWWNNNCRCAVSCSGMSGFSKSYQEYVGD